MGPFWAYGQFLEKTPILTPLKTRFFRVQYTPFWTFLSTCIILMFFYHFLCTFWLASVSLFHVFLILSDINHSLEHVFVIRCVVLMNNNYMFILTLRRTQMIMNVSWNAFFNFSTRGGTAHHSDPFQESLYFLQTPASLIQIRFRFCIWCNLVIVVATLRVAP